jgi:hypothetical protein
VSPRACLDDVEKRKFLTLPGIELRPLGRPARSQSLYRLRYSGSRVLPRVPVLNRNAPGSEMCSCTLGFSYEQVLLYIFLDIHHSSFCTTCA